MKFILVCSGTAGHINPALAIASALRARYPQSQFLFIGAGRELENKLVPRAGFELINIKMSGLQRSISLKNIARNAKTVRNLISASNEAGQIISSFKPNAVIGTGGYVCYPVLKNAARARIPSYIHESNAEPGLATKLLSGVVDNVFTSFPGTHRRYRSPDRVLFTGTPVREEFRQAAEDARQKAGRPLVVSFWGSLGAELMNGFMAEFIKLNIENDCFDHIHAAGGKNGVSYIYERLDRLGYSGELPPGVQLREYIDDMPTIMAAADLVLSRAGGSTIGELIALGKPAVLAPSPYVTNNQQVKNAAQISNSGGAMIIQEKDCTGALLYKTVTMLLNDKNRLKLMSDSMKNLSDGCAELKIADIICKRVGTTG